MDSYGKNLRLKVELSNELYDVVDETIAYMDKEKKYNENDILKLILALYKAEYKYITNNNGYRDQIILLNQYFEKEYNHSVISFILIKTLANKDLKDLLEKEIEDNNIREQILYFLETGNYIELLDLLESEKNIFLSVAKVYVMDYKRKD